MKRQGFISGNLDTYWLKIENSGDIDDLMKWSHENPVLFFKHSTRCSISLMVLSKFEKKWNHQLSECPLYLIDVLEQRPSSNYLSEITRTEHQSPQVLLIWKETPIYFASHTAIDVEEINRHLSEIK